MIARRVAGETVLVPLAARASDPEFKSARLFVLNETGAPPSTTAIIEIQGNLRLLFSREALKRAAELIPTPTLTSAYANLPSLVSQNYWRNVTQ